MRISDWSSDVCSSDLTPRAARPGAAVRSHQRKIGGLQPAARGAPRRMGGARRAEHRGHFGRPGGVARKAEPLGKDKPRVAGRRSEEHTSELQSLMRISYAVFCLKTTRTACNIKTPYS